MTRNEIGGLLFETLLSLVYRNLGRRTFQTLSVISNILDYGLGVFVALLGQYGVTESVREHPCTHLLSGKYKYVHDLPTPVEKTLFVGVLTTVTGEGLV